MELLNELPPDATVGIDTTYLERVRPANGEHLGRVQVGSSREARSVCAAARRAQMGWSATSAAERGGLLREAAARLEKMIDRVARLNTDEMGKPFGDSTGGVRAAISAISMYAELGPLHRGRALQGDAGAFDMMRWVPRGLAACIVPWNDPVAIAAQGISANLAVGNTVVLKPSERASFSVAAMLECFDHLPDGVLNVIYGDRSTGRALIDQRPDVVTFTGSVRAGQQILAATSDRATRTVLELGGNDALIVDAGVDPEWAAQQCALGAFANAGQICVSVERVICHREIAGPFVEALVRAAKEWEPGDPNDASTRMGPLVDLEHRVGVHRQVEQALGRGAELHCGGAIPEGRGSFYPPTVLTEVDLDSDLWRTETFGPVAAVSSVDSFDDAIEVAAADSYGLAATVLTKDLGRALASGGALGVGTLKINSVFGGAPGGAAHPRGLSGNALGYGPELLDELAALQVIHANNAQ